MTAVKRKFWKSLWNATSHIEEPVQNLLEGALNAVCSCQEARKGAVDKQAAFHDNVATAATGHFSRAAAGTQQQQNKPLSSNQGKKVVAALEQPSQAASGCRGSRYDALWHRLSFSVLLFSLREGADTGLSTTCQSPQA